MVGKLLETEVQVSEGSVALKPITPPGSRWEKRVHYGDCLIGFASFLARIAFGLRLIFSVRSCCALSPLAFAPPISRTSNFCSFQMAGNAGGDSKRQIRLKKGGGPGLPASLLPLAGNVRLT